MKIGVRAHDFGRNSIENIVKIITEAGFTCTQLAPTKAIEGIANFADITENHIEKIQTAFADLEITVLGCYIEPSVTDKETRLKNVEIFKNNLTYAKKLGVKIVGTETTHLDTNTPQAEREKIYALLKDSVLRLAEHAEKENVFIGIEPVAEHTLNTPELTKRLLDEVNSNQLKIIFDPVNLVLPETISRQNEIFQQTFDLIGEEIVAVHIKDIVIENNQKVWREIGQGVIDYTQIMGWLLKNKPHVNMLREGVTRDSYENDLRVMLKMSL